MPARIQAGAPFDQLDRSKWRADQLEALSSRTKGERTVGPERNAQIELRLSGVGRPVERRDIGPSLAFRQNTSTTSKLPLSHKMYNGWNNEHPGGQQGSNVSLMVFMWLHATVMTRTRYIDN